MSLSAFISSSVLAEGDDPVVLLQNLKPGTATEIVIPPGRDILPESGLLLEGLTGVTIEASGVTFLASNPVKSAIDIRNCKSLTIRGLTLDYDPLPFTQGTIVSIDKESNTAVVEIHKGYPELTADYLVPRMHVFEADKHYWKDTVGDIYLRDIKAESPTQAIVTFQDADKNFEHIELGDRVAFNIRKAAGILVKGYTEGLVLEDCKINAAPGIGVLVRFAKDAGTYRNLRIAPGPTPDGATEPRLLSTNADGFNAAYTREGPTITGCDFSYMGDDAINLHGVTLPILEWEDERTCLSMRPFGNDSFEQILHPGDEARFLLQPDFRVGTTAIIESIERAEASLEKWRPVALDIWPSYRNFKNATFFRIRFQEPVKDIPAGSSFCEFFTSSASGYVMRDNYFHDHRARGLRLMAGDGLVENNRFERIKGPAISIGPEFAYWKEAGWVKDLTIHNNHIENVGTAAYVLHENSYTLGAISLFAHMIEQGEGAVYYPGNENITIVGNTIKNSPMDAVSICASRGIVVRDNTISDVNHAKPGKSGSKHGLWSGAPITVIQSDALIENNHIEMNLAPEVTP